MTDLEKCRMIVGTIFCVIETDTLKKIDARPIYERLELALTNQTTLRGQDVASEVVGYIRKILNDDIGISELNELVSRANIK